MTGTPHARKILGSVAAVAVTATVAGLGTFGTFTDSTSGDTGVQSGSFTIDVGVPGGPSTIPVSTANFLPGDSLTRGALLLGAAGRDSSRAPATPPGCSGTRPRFN